MERKHIREGDFVTAFDPRTLGVVKTGLVTKVGRKYAHIDFGLTGPARVPFRDVVSLIPSPSL